MYTFAVHILAVCNDDDLCRSSQLPLPPDMAGQQAANGCLADDTVRSEQQYVKIIATEHDAKQ